MICPHCGKDTDDQPTLALTGGEAPERAAILMPLIGGKQFAVTPSHLRKFSTVFSGVAIMRELEKAQMWLEANPSRRPKSNMLEFLRRWLTRAQNSLGGDYGRPRGFEAEREQFNRIARKNGGN